MAFPNQMESPARITLKSEGSVNRSTHVFRNPVTEQPRLSTPLEVERFSG